jgi:hypothetical protein
VLDYFVIPENYRRPTQLTVQAEDDLVVGLYRFDDISFLKSLARRSKLKEAG